MQTSCEGYSIAMHNEECVIVLWPTNKRKAFELTKVNVISIKLLFRLPRAERVDYKSLLV